MTLSITNGRQAYLKTLLDLDVGFNTFAITKSVTNFKIVTDVSIKYLIKLILYENDLILFKLKRKPVQVDLKLGCLLFKKSKTFNESCSLSKAARIPLTYLK